MPVIYDLEDRTLRFAIEIIKLCKIIPKDVVTTPLISQLVRSGTSIGANYREANGASSQKDFRNKIFICKKESKETIYWTILIGEAISENIPKVHILKNEAEQLTLIFWPN